MEVKRRGLEAGFRAANQEAIALRTEHETKSQHAAYWAKELASAEVAAAQYPQLKWRVDEVRARMQAPIPEPFKELVRRDVEKDAPSPIDRVIRRIDEVAGKGKD